MKLHLKALRIDFLDTFKVLVIDQSRTKEEGRLLYIAEDKNPNLAMQDAMDFCKAVRMTLNSETVWN